MSVNQMLFVSSSSQHSLLSRYSLHIMSSPVVLFPLFCEKEPPQWILSDRTSNTFHSVVKRSMNCPVVVSGCDPCSQFTTSMRLSDFVDNICWDVEFVLALRSEEISVQRVGESGECQGCQQSVPRWVRRTQRPKRTGFEFSHPNKKEKILHGLLVDWWDIHINTHMHTQQKCKDFRYIP